MQIQTILDQIDLDAMALPEFQRGYVWNRDQVRGLMTSLYRRYPVGSLMVWITPKQTAKSRGNSDGHEGNVELLLDGQQRVTSLYGVIRGSPPRFFDGDASTFTGLHFDLGNEVFEFYAPAKMRGSPFWIDVTRVMREGVGPAIQQVMKDPVLSRNAAEHIARITAIHGIRTVDLHVEKVTGSDKTVDVVVDIFNRVNSGGTKLSKGDLALAKICAQWPDARHEMKGSLKRWSEHGFYFQLDWLLRNITTITTGEARFSALASIETTTFADGLQKAEKAANRLLNLIGSRLGLDHDRVLGGRYAFPVMTKYLVERGGQFQTAMEQDRLLYWYIQSFLWGRFTGSVETVLNQDLALVDASAGSLDKLINQLRLSRGDLQVRPEDFGGWSLGARFYPMLYLLTRMRGARDWGVPYPELKVWLLGKGASLEVHHVFPKALLYRNDYYRSEVNALANFCFLTKETNIGISDKEPLKYFPEIAAKSPGVLESQWIPIDERLWRVENYRDFLDARRSLLADAANGVLEELLHRSAEDQPVDVPTELRIAGTQPDIAEALDPEIVELLAWIDQRKLPPPQVDLEIVDPETQTPIVVADLAWPRGVQEGLGDPLAFELGADDRLVTQLATLGYRCFTTSDSLRRYLEAGHNGLAEEAKPTPRSAVEQRFHQAMTDVYERARREAGYTAARFLSMLSEVGGLETAHRLLRAPEPSDGFVNLWSKGRLDLSVEAHALRPEFQELFSPEELERARQRLEAVGFDRGTAHLKV
jgi:hypothetical protein